MNPLFLLSSRFQVQSNQSLQRRNDYRQPTPWLCRILMAKERYARFLIDCCYYPFQILNEERIWIGILLALIAYWQSRNRVVDFCMFLKNIISIGLWFKFKFELCTRTGRSVLHLVIVLLIIEQILWFWSLQVSDSMIQEYSYFHAQA